MHYYKFSVSKHDKTLIGDSAGKILIAIKIQVASWKAGHSILKTALSRVSSTVSHTNTI